MTMCAATSAQAADALRERATGLGLTCVDSKTVDGPEYVRCDGELASFDGVGLRITLALSGAELTLPAIRPPKNG